MDDQLRFHHDAFALLGERPQFSDVASDSLRQRESELGIVLPDSVRELYSQENRRRYLTRFERGGDNPFDFADLELSFDDWVRGDAKKYLAEDLLVFLYESQGVVRWAAKLDGNPDPEVVVQWRDAPDRPWIRCADSFSTFVWSRVWDDLPNTIGVSATCQPRLTRSDLGLLNSEFRQLVTTYGFVGRTNYRFAAVNGGILIMDGESEGVDWYVWAHDDLDLKSILMKVWHCGKLARSLYASHGGDYVLEQLRDEAE